MIGLNQIDDPLAGTSADGGALAQIRIPAAPRYLKLIRCFVREWGKVCGATPETVHELVLAVDEACQNVIRHAYRAGDRGDLVVDLRQCDDRVEINVIDFAPPIDPSRVKPRSLDELRPGGLGVHFIHECMDDWAFRPAPPGCGNRLWMSKRITPD